MDIADKQYEARKRREFMKIVVQQKEKKKKEQFMELKRSGKVKNK